jgi:hypothetical protein
MNILLQLLKRGGVSLSMEVVVKLLEFSHRCISGAIESVPLSLEFSYTSFMQVNYVLFLV